MRMLRAIGLGTLAALLATGHLLGQDEGGSLHVSAMVGVQNQPGGFDVFRSVEYDPGVVVGGALVVGLFPRVAIRGDIAHAMSSGQEASPVNESVDLNRTYYGASLELRLPTSVGFSPYVFAGGGLVNLRRKAPTYNFDLTESAALLGGGVAYDFSGSSLSAFAQVTEWIYNRTSAGGTQYDTALGVGLAYRFSP